MAAVAATADMTVLKNSQILVYVEEALSDLIVVSYCADNKKFQGILLDSKKGNLPFGVYNLHPAFSKQPAAADTNDDKLHSASQRFLYEDPDCESNHSQKKKPAKSKPQQRQKMTVRLRPRKVLCSNCKGICNENNENVDLSKKRKRDSDDEAPRESDSSRNLREQKKYLVAGGMLIPKLSRLHPSEISSALKGVSKNSNKASDKPVKSDSESITPDLAFVSVSDGDINDNTKSEDIVSSSTVFSSARTLKICFGEGEGTVVKIPPLTGEFNEDSGVSCDMKPESKAAKKALKKAKKQAKKNSVQTKRLSQSPKHIGALSPRNVADSPTLDSLEKRHKHRVKHKKKYKANKKRDENLDKDSETMDYFSDIKELCTSQKLSISLRRLSSNSFEQQDDVENSDDEDMTTGISEEKSKLGPLQDALNQDESQKTDPLGSPFHHPLESPSMLASPTYTPESPTYTLASPAHSLASPSTQAHSPHHVDVLS